MAAAASSPAMAVAAPLLTTSRWETTGDNYSYKPGPIAKGLRFVFASLAPSALKKKIALRMQAGMEQAEALERQHMWLRKHGSPLQVMGLPDHAELPEVRARYRSLILETHPDTSKHHGGGKGGLTTAVTASDSEHDILQTAYRMAVDPLSLWHRNGASPALYQELLRATKRRAGRVDRVRAFAIFSYAFMLLCGLFFATVICKNGLEVALQFFDPEFYTFMRGQEEEEKRKLEAGEYIDADPKRLAPAPVRKLLFPGRYIHSEEGEVEGVTWAGH